MNKHPDDYVFGLDKDIQNKIAAKFDPEKQAQAQAWVETLTGEKFPGSFHESLKDGILLCKALNVIKPGLIQKINTGQMPFVQRENIVNYLEGCKKLGMKVIDCFVTQDLYEGDNLVAVIDQIFALGALSRSVEGFDGPFLGVKFAEENRREFSEEQIIAGKQAIPLQNAGSIPVEKDKGTDQIVRYGKVGQEMGHASSEVSQQVGGSIEIEKDKGTDFIVRYGKVGQEMGQASSELSQQNAGSLEVDKGKGTDTIVRYGKVGQEMGHASSESSQQNAGSIEVDKGKGTDTIVRYGKVGQEMGNSVSGDVPLHNAGSVEVEKDKHLDSINRSAPE
jgi:predicted DNA-binding WGR domain protein